MYFRTSECIQEHSPCNVVMNSSTIAAQHYHEICPDEQSTCLQQHWTASQCYLIDSSDVESSVQSLPDDTSPVQLVYGVLLQLLWMCNLLLKHVINKIRSLNRMTLMTIVTLNFLHLLRKRNEKTVERESHQPHC